MLRGLFNFFSNNNKLKKYAKIVEQINSYDSSMSMMTDIELQNQTNILREKIANGCSLEQLLPEAFATVKEAANRTLFMKHFDVQLIGGIVLHNGGIAEMKTGEGKTLVSTLPIYLNALTGQGVHVVTVNDYLTVRDSEWMGKIYQFLGLSVGRIYDGCSHQDRLASYQCDITYGTGNEFGFDYLRNNMSMTKDNMMRNNFNYVVVDEVDSILIDEARTPLIISGAVDTATQIYHEFNKLVKFLNDSHYEIDFKNKNVIINDEGWHNLEKILIKKSIIKPNTTLYDYENIHLINCIQQSLCANLLFSKDIDYIIKDKAIVLIDEFTGRMMEDRRYSNGLHQALEAKEGLRINHENKTMASITFQNYFNIYNKIAGMTGTAATESVEFRDIYGLHVVEIPTNKLVKRLDHEDAVYATSEDKLHAVINLIAKCYDKQQPVLVGTISIEQSEYLMKKLKKEKNIKASVLNAKNHANEAQIIAQAGALGAVTIATNMAGRGTDIQLGGAPEKYSNKEQFLDNKNKVIEAGGLFVIGSERHENRRIDNQLRGRSGRQGDIGESKFFLSLEDNLLKIFGGSKINNLLTTMGMKDDQPLTHSWISKAIANSQKKVEKHNFEIRKNLLKFDNVLNEQRKIIYEQRQKIIIADNLDGYIDSLLDNFIADLVEKFAESDHEEIKNYLLDFHINNIVFANDLGQDLKNSFVNKINVQKQNHSQEVWSFFATGILLQVIDNYWQDHLDILSELKRGINLRAYAQLNPLNEYKVEAFNLFTQLLCNIRYRFFHLLCLVEIKEEIKSLQQSNDISNDDNQNNNKHDYGKIGRNSPCPCLSGKKFKNCHGKNA